MFHGTGKTEKAGAKPTAKEKSRKPATEAAADAPARTFHIRDTLDPEIVRDREAANLFHFDVGSHYETVAFGR